MNIKSQNKRSFLPWVSSILLGGSLSILCLFNLPLFYEQDRLGMVRTFVATLVIFCLVAAFSSKLLLIPLKYFQVKDITSMIFVTLLSLIFMGIFYFTSSYYWSTPKFQSVEICYSSGTPAAELKLYSISDPRIGRVFPAKFFGPTSYPILISANTCITGGIRTVQKWQGIILDLEAKENDGSITIEINRQITRKSLGSDDDSVGRKNINIPAGPFRGSPIYPNIFSNNLLIFSKWIALILSAIYLAMVVFAISEIILLLVEEPIISYKVMLALVLAYFVIFGLIMVNHSGQPDQVMHEYYSSRYSETWGIPKEDPESPFYITDNEYLYYWINGAALKLYHLLARVENRSTNRLLWRLISVTLSSGTLYYIYQLASKVTGNKFGGTLAAFLAANMLMFVFVSGGISYDNLMNLSSVAAIYHMVCILKSEDYVKNTAWMGIWLSLGALSKDQVALLAFILFFIWLSFSIKNRRWINLHFTYTNIILVVILALTFGLFLEFYGGNLIRYHRPIPICRQVKDPKFCTNLSYRGSQYQKVDYGDLWVNRNSIVGPLAYFGSFWLYEGMINGIWGIVSHNAYIPRFTTSLQELLIIWTVLCLARYWKKADSISVVLLIVLLSYAGYVFFMNYNSELHYNFRHYAVQGRYLFPVLGAFLALLVNSFLKIKPLFLKRLTLSLAIILYFAGGLGTFVFRYSDVFIAWRIFY